MRSHSKGSKLEELDVCAGLQELGLVGRAKMQWGSLLAGVLKCVDPGLRHWEWGVV